MDLSRFFEKFKPKEGVKLLPSEAAELEVERWEIYKKLITKRSKKYLKKDKKELQKYLVGNTFPLSQVFENNQDRLIELNPLFDIDTRTFPLWSNIKLAVDNIGIDLDKDKEYPTVKTAINESLRNIIDFIKSRDWEKINDEVQRFDSRLEKARKGAISHVLAKKVLLNHYPTPKDIYVD